MGHPKATHTPSERAERWETCIRYLKRHGDIPAAQRAAKRDSVAFPTAVWLTALSKMLMRGEFPGD